MVNDIDNRLADIRQQLERNEASPTPTVREFISWVGAQRRGYYVVQDLRDALTRAGLDTYPDFNALYIDSPIAFVLLGWHTASSGVAPGDRVAAEEEISDQARTELATEVLIADDPRHRVSRLASANRPPTAIAPTASLDAAITTMLTNDFSQLPVMAGERDVKGVISWESIAKRLATKKGGTEARHFMVPAQTVAHEESLLLAMRKVSEHGYVLVLGPDKKVRGIVTTTDINEQFMQLTEPFLLVGEIEQALRVLLDRLPAERLQGACDPNDPERVVGRAADLTFGEYVRLLQDPGVWTELDIPLDRGVFVKCLDEVRQTRNDIMHFDTDAIPDASLDQLRNLVKLLDWLRS